MADKRERQSKRTAKKCAEVSRILIREEVRAQTKRVSEILKKNEDDRSEEDHFVLQQSQDVVHGIQKRAKTRELAKQRQLEIEDSDEVLNSKCEELAAALKNAKFAVVYSGAGISTAASIPDYRGPNGVWTLLQQGKEIMAQDLSDAEPTFTHMCITRLYKQSLVKYVVSQNCDGLHIRSGLPRQALSELHGNMYIELCTNCQPQREYLRLFDTTERTGVRRHGTERECPVCTNELRDTIVHFGEKSPGFKSPYNWEEAVQAADSADVLLCLGTSLKVLKKYPCLWSNHKPAYKRPKLYIVNLQWTPKDDLATLKINGKCDQVMQIVADKLGVEVPDYRRELDHIFSLASPLTAAELPTTTKKVLVEPADYLRAQVDAEIWDASRLIQANNKRKRKSSGFQEQDNGDPEGFDWQVNPGKKKKSARKKGLITLDSDAVPVVTETQELLAAVESILPGSDCPSPAAESTHTVMAPPITPPPALQVPAAVGAEPSTVSFTGAVAGPSRLAVERVLPRPDAGGDSEVIGPPPKLIPLEDVEEQVVTTESETEQKVQEQAQEQQAAQPAQQQTAQQAQQAQQAAQWAQEQQAAQQLGQQVILHAQAQQAKQQQAQQQQAQQQQAQQHALQQQAAQQSQFQALKKQVEQQQALEQQQAIQQHAQQQQALQQRAQQQQALQQHAQQQQAIQQQQAHLLQARQQLTPQQIQQQQAKNQARQQALDEQQEAERRVALILADHKRRAQQLEESGALKSAKHPQPKPSTSKDPTTLVTPPAKDAHILPPVRELCTIRNEPHANGAPVPAKRSIQVKSRSSIIIHTPSATSPDRFQTMKMDDSESQFPAFEGVYMPTEVQAYLEQQSRIAQKTLGSPATTPVSYQPETVMVSPVSTPPISLASPTAANPKLQTAYLMGVESARRQHQAMKHGLSPTTAVPREQVLSPGATQRQPSLAHLADAAALSKNMVAPSNVQTNVSRAMSDWMSALERTRPTPPQEQVVAVPQAVPHRSPDIHKATANWMNAKTLLEHNLSRPSSVASNEASNPVVPPEPAAAAVVVQQRGVIEHWEVAQGRPEQLVRAEVVPPPEANRPADPVRVESIIKAELRMAIQARAASRNKIAAEHKGAVSPGGVPQPAAGQSQPVKAAVPDRLSKAAAAWEHAKNVTKMNANLANLANAAMMESSRLPQGVSTPPITTPTTTTPADSPVINHVNLSQLAHAASMEAAASVSPMSPPANAIPGDATVPGAAARFPAIVQAMLGSVGVNRDAQQPAVTPRGRRGRTSSVAAGSREDPPKRRRRRTTSTAPSVAELLARKPASGELLEGAGADRRISWPPDGTATVDASQLAQFADIANAHAAATAASRPHTLMIARPANMMTSATPAMGGTPSGGTPSAPATTTMTTNYKASPGVPHLTFSAAPNQSVTLSTQGTMATGGTNTSAATGEFTSSTNPSAASSSGSATPNQMAVDAQLAADMIARSMANMMARSASTMGPHETADFLARSVAYMNAQIKAQLGAPESPKGSPSVSPPPVTTQPTSSAPTVSSVSFPAVQASPVSIKPPAAHESPVSVKPPAAQESPVSVKPPAAQESPVSVKPPAAHQSPVSVKPPAVQGSPVSVKPPAAQESAVSVKPPAAQESPVSVKPPDVQGSPVSVKLPAAQESSVSVKPPAAQESNLVSERRPIKKRRHWINAPDSRINPVVVLEPLRFPVAGGSRISASRVAANAGAQVKQSGTASGLKATGQNKPAENTEQRQKGSVAADFPNAQFGSATTDSQQITSDSQPTQTNSATTDSQRTESNATTNSQPKAQECRVSVAADGNSNSGSEADVSKQSLNGRSDSGLSRSASEETDDSAPPGGQVKKPSNPANNDNEPRQLSVGSAPGWFGKGINLKRSRRKKYAK